LAKKSRVDIFDPTKSQFQIICLLAWPVLVENIMSTLVNYADTAMVGSLGAYATAAVSLCNPAMFLVTGAVLALGTGVTVLIARSIGAGDFNLTKKLTRLAIMLIVVLGIPLCALYAAMHRVIPIWMGAGPDILDYSASYNLIVACGRPFAMCTMVLGSVFRGAGDTKSPMYVNLGVNVVNVIGNFFLINPTRQMNILGMSITMPGACWGVSGAAAATAISMTIGGIIMLCMVFMRPGATQISLRDDFRIDWKLFRQVWNISLPAIFERISNLLGGILISATVASLGTIAIASNTLHGTAEQIAMMPAFSMQMAATTMVGQYLGARMSDKAEKVTMDITKYALIIITITCVVLFVCAEHIVSFFTPDADVIMYATRMVRIMTCAQPIQMAAFVISGALRGAGDTRVTMYIVAVSNWLVRILGTVLCIRVFGLGQNNIQLGLDIICMFMCADIVVRALLFYKRFRSGKWKTAIKDDPAPAKPVEAKA